MKFATVLLRSAIAGALFVSLNSCSEDLDSSGVCGVLCPPVGGDVQNVTLDAVVFDTTVQSFSGLGTEPGLLLANRGDTLDTRVILRFDSLPRTFIPAGDTARPITSVDSAFIQLKLDTLSIKSGASVTIEAYDVDTTANDTSTAAVLALFRPDRFISSQTFQRSELKDTLRYFISNQVLLSKIGSHSQLRIGLRAAGTTSTQLRFGSVESSQGPFLSFRATPDTATARIAVTLFSHTPADDPIVAFSIRDYTVVAKAPPPGPPGDLDIGGLPARRTYLRFDIPKKYTDSSNIVRATLLLNQIPNSALDPTDTVRLVSHLVVAANAVTDPTKAAQVIAQLPLDTVIVRPGDAGPKAIELARAFTFWRSQDPTLSPRAIVLRSVAEGSSPLEIRFWSTEAAAALRPQLRISYTNRVPLGLP